MFRRKPVPDLIRDEFRFVDKDMRTSTIPGHVPIPKDPSMLSDHATVTAVLPAW
jgi:hypothetical protein